MFYFDLFIYFSNYSVAISFSSMIKITIPNVRTGKPTLFSWSAAILFVHRYTAGSTSAGDKANKLCNRNIACKQCSLISQLQEKLFHYSIKRRVEMK